jgi:GGDEF domain-containing protein
LFSLGLAALTFWLAGEGPSEGYLALGCLFSFGLGLLAWTKDRGVFSLPGLVQVGAFGLMFGVGWILVRLAPDDVAAFLAWKPASLPAINGLRAPQPLVLAFGFAVISAVLVGIRRGGPVEKGWIWALVFVGLGFVLTSDPTVPGIFLLGAGLTLGFSVMETSYAMAYKDDLTGLPARRALMRDLGLLGGSYTAAMVDVDHFKRFNDRYGHDVGDQVLRMVAARLAKAPGGGRAYRYSGEEFTLLFPGRTLKETLPHLKETRRSVEEAAFTLRSWRRPRKKPVDPGAWRGGRKKKPRLLSVTVSIGAAESAGRETSPEVVLKKADRALYRAKKGGRNRVAK